MADAGPYASGGFLGKGDFDGDLDVSTEDLPDHLLMVILLIIKEKHQNVHVILHM